ncbi:MAG: 4-(cytidine 5'-diphospho)-2-C-methyl-D-erythritol kinase [Fimbriimonas sp.]
MTLEVACPAKLNLFLAVGPRDQRGYHPLRTIFQAVSLADRLVVSTDTDQDRFECDWPEVPAENTVTRVWRLLKEIAPLPPLYVRLQKHIPLESGMGGGSSDAAGMIRAVEALIGKLPSKAEREAVATAVGMDVPFFLVGGRAKAEGYGDLLTPEQDRPESESFVVLRPDLGCSTAAMYRALDDRAFDWRDFPTEDEAHNDFERVAPCECLDLIEWLNLRGAVQAGLSGSGSAVWGRFASAEVAEQVESMARSALGVWSRAVRSLNRRESMAIQRA